MNEVVEMIERVRGAPLNLTRGPGQAGDVQQTGGSIDRAMSLLSWKPEVSLEEGLRSHYEWAKSEFSQR
jgi:nucleoside-diphosphate-sugar epimerase